MSWEEQSIEQKLRIKLRAKLTPTKADELYSDYTSARKELVDTIYPEIKSTEPSLSYHDTSHVINVLNNAEKLLETDDDELLSRLSRKWTFRPLDLMVTQLPLKG